MFLWGHLYGYVVKIFEGHTCLINPVGVDCSMTIADELIAKYLDAQSPAISPRPSEPARLLLISAVFLLVWLY